MLSQGQEDREAQEGPKELKACCIAGPKPSLWDVSAEAERLQLGPQQKSWFEAGAILTLQGLTVSGGARPFFKWAKAGATWVTEEIERRAALSEASR